MSEFRTRVRSALRPDYVVAALALAVVAVGIALAILLPGAGAKIVAVVASAAIGFVVRMLGKRASMEWTLRRYRHLAARDPLALFHDMPPVEAPALESRTRLMDAVVAELDAQRRPGRELSPVVVVGEAGAGKTTFAAALARRFAREHRAPVVIALRGMEDAIDFERLAGARFGEVVDRQGLGGSAEHLWRYARRSRQCVAIADGLDERVADSGAGGVTETTHDILTAEPARAVPLVVTSRPDGLREDDVIKALGLGDLPEGYVADALVEDCGGALPERQAREITRHLGLTRRPLYFRVARDLARADGGAAGSALVATLDTIDIELARCHLLDSRLETFTAERASDRRAAIDTLSAVALIALRLGARRGSVERQDEPGAEAWLRQVAGTPLERRTALDAAVGLTFVRIDAGRVSFRHPIIQSYLAARALDLTGPGPGREPEWERLLDAGSSDEVLRALRTYAMRLILNGNRHDAEPQVAALAHDLKRRAAAPRLSGTQRLALLGTAAHVLGSAGADSPGALSAQREDLERTIAGGWDADCPLATKRDAITWLARMSGAAAFESAWAIAVQDDSYAFRWAVVEAMAESGTAAADALTATVRPMVEGCRKWARAPDSTDDDLSEERVSELSIVAKFLPSGNEAPAGTPGAGIESEAAAVLTAELGQAVREMVARNRALGVEASLAQGLKHAARRYPLSDPNLDEAERLATGGRFWYARIMALHALLRHAIAGEDTQAAYGDGTHPIERAGQSAHAALADPHPWVAEAARQVEAALASLRSGREDEARTFVWHDEAAQLARSGEALDDATARLLGDIALVLNMNEQGRHEISGDGQRVAHPSDRALVPGCDKCRHQLEVGTSNDLPHCLSRDADRQRILHGGCDCSFRLCPYDFAAYRKAQHAHRGQPSAQFCAGQRAVANALGPPPWQPALSVDAYVEFWDAMERQGRGR